MYLGRVNEQGPSQVKKCLFCQVESGSKMSFLRYFLWKWFFAKTSCLCLRSDVMQELDAEIWRNRDRLYIVRMLKDLQTRI